MPIFSAHLKPTTLSDGYLRIRNHTLCIMEHVDTSVFPLITGMEESGVLFSYQNDVYELMNALLAASISRQLEWLQLARAAGKAMINMGPMLGIPFSEEPRALDHYIASDNVKWQSIKDLIEFHFRELREESEQTVVFTILNAIIHARPTSVNKESIFEGRRVPAVLAVLQNLGYELTGSLKALQSWKGRSPMPIGPKDFLDAVTRIVKSQTPAGLDDDLEDASDHLACVAVPLKTQVKRSYHSFKPLSLAKRAHEDAVKRGDKEEVDKPCGTEPWLKRASIEHWKEPEQVEEEDEDDQHHWRRFEDYFDERARQMDREDTKTLFVASLGALDVCINNYLSRAEGDLSSSAIELAHKEAGGVDEYWKLTDVAREKMIQRHLKIICKNAAEEIVTSRVRDAIEAITKRLGQKDSDTVEMATLKLAEKEAATKAILAKYKDGFGPSDWMTLCKGPSS